MGSGGMIVMDDSACMVNVARYFMEFCMSESCGKCIPCRAGTAQMFELLTRMTSGTATPHDLELLEDLCDMVSNTSLCGLGQSAPNPVLSTLRYFREEYTEHIVDKHCRAGVCECSKLAEVPHESGARCKTLVIDGTDVSASSDQTILDAAQEMGFRFLPYAISMD